MPDGRDAQLTVRSYIALGGNVGDVEENFRAAVAGLAATPGIAVVAQSPIFRTQPVGQWAGGEFLNAAVGIDTQLDPLPLLDVLQQLDRAAGPRKGPRWAPRPLDLDLIFYGDRTIDDPRLVVPHPASWYRRFVLDPLEAIAAGLPHPTKGQSVAELRARLLRRPLRLSLAGGSRSGRERLARVLSGPAVEITQWERTQANQPAPELLAWLGPDEDEPRLGFEILPLLPRLDASVAAAADTVEFLRDVLHSALGYAQSLNDSTAR
jgi:2-amino-4-hydroxy-6-hydroxymethyldihydropteridine diphosphokinase